MDLVFSSWLVWFLAGVAIMLAELALPGFVIRIVLSHRIVLSLTQKPELRILGVRKREFCCGGECYFMCGQ